LIMRLRVFDMKKEKFYLVYGQWDGWVVYTNKKEALEDYKDCLERERNARMVEVEKIKEYEYEKRIFERK